MSTAEQNLLAIQTAYDHFAVGDIDAMGVILDANAEIVEAESLPYAGSYYGPEGLKQVVGKITSLWDGLGFDIKHLVGDDDIVLAYGELSGTGKATGRHVSFSLVEAWHFKDGKVVRVEPIYSDTALVNSILTAA